jgi:hypothetical protein
MKKSFLFVFLFLVSFIMSCDDPTKTAALLLLAGNSDKTQVIQEVIGDVSKQLISEGKAQVVTYEGDEVSFKGKKYIMPVAPYTYSDLQNALTTALEKKLGSQWNQTLNSAINNKNEKTFKTSEIPDEITPSKNEKNYQVCATQDTGSVLHYFPSVGVWATARAKQNSGWLPWTTPWGFIWWIGLTQFNQTFQFNTALSAYPTIDFVLYDVNGNPYTWSNGTTTWRITSCGSADLLTVLYQASFTQTQLYTTGWNLTVYAPGTGTPDVWYQGF